MEIKSAVSGRGSVILKWEEWAIGGPGLTIAFDYSDRQPRPTERLAPEGARELRDYLNSLPLD